MEMTEKRLLNLLGRPDYRPMNKSELARALEIPSDERSVLRQCLRQLEAAGSIVSLKKGRYALQLADSRTLTGVFFQKCPGGGEVLTKDTDAAATNPRFFIPEGCSGTAMNGDRVLIRRRRTSEQRPEPHWLKKLPERHRQAARKRFDETPRLPEAEVIQVLERHAQRWLGTLQGTERFASFRPDDPLLPPIMDLPEGLPKNAHSGDKVLATLVRWGGLGERPEARVTKVLGNPDAPGVDILCVIHRLGLRTHFSQEVIQEAAAIAKQEPQSGAIYEDREDWRDVDVITIDPFDARDFDDAIAVKSLPDGGWELAVHIADVSHYVTPGSALDREAKARGNSVYLVDRVLPMLPEALSNGLCSLKPGVDRLTFCAWMHFNSAGKMIATRFFPAVIRSRMRLSYEEAYTRMQSTQDTESDPVTSLLHRAWSLAAKLRKRRFHEGSLDLDFPETKIILNDQGRPVEIRSILYDESHQLIEECMLAANEAVATTLRRAGKPAIYRIHEDPDYEKLMEFREIAKTHGYRAGDLGDRLELQRLLVKMRGRPDEHLMKLALLKSLKRALYAAEPLGHYGLAKANYTHFTSPIRRYSDLIVHRVLRKILNSSLTLKTPSQDKMMALAQHVSDTERRASEAEIQSRRIKEIAYFADLLDAAEPTIFKAVVTEISPMGLFVELKGLNTRGLIRSAGANGQLGDTLNVQVARVDRSRLHVDFRFA